MNFHTVDFNYISIFIYIMGAWLMPSGANSRRISVRWRHLAPYSRQFASISVVSAVANDTISSGAYFKSTFHC